MAYINILEQPQVNEVDSLLGIKDDKVVQKIEKNLTLPSNFMELTDAERLVYLKKAPTKFTLTSEGETLSGVISLIKTDNNLSFYKLTIHSTAVSEGVITEADQSMLFNIDGSFSEYQDVSYAEKLFMDLEVEIENTNAKISDLKNETSKLIKQKTPSNSWIGSALAAEDAVALIRFNDSEAIWTQTNFDIDKVTAGLTKNNLDLINKQITFVYLNGAQAVICAEVTNVTPKYLVLCVIPFKDIL